MSRLSDILLSYVTHYTVILLFIICSAKFAHAKIINICNFLKDIVTPLGATMLQYYFFITIA